jgi:hypothetical protein
MGEWRPIETAPKDGTEILVWYADYLGQRDFVVSAHWCCEEGREFEATWEHSLGFGDADMWQPLPGPPALTLAQPST